VQNEGIFVLRQTQCCHFFGTNGAKCFCQSVAIFFSSLTWQKRNFHYLSANYVAILKMCLAKAWLFNFTTIVIFPPIEHLLFLGSSHAAASSHSNASQLFKEITISGLPLMCSVRKQSGVAEWTIPAYCKSSLAVEVARNVIYAVNSQEDQGEES